MIDTGKISQVERCTFWTIHWLRQLFVKLEAEGRLGACEEIAEFANDLAREEGLPFPFRSEVRVVPTNHADFPKVTLIRPNG